jgi:hypothetical protein
MYFAITCCCCQGRHHEYPLRLKGGGQLVKPGQVAYLDKGAAYTLAAAHAGKGRRCDI